MKNTYVRGLNGIRATAVSMVIFHHVFKDSAGRLNTVAYNAGFGVEMFFVLSGFLITHLLLNEEQEQGRIHLKNFYLRRAIRILPPAVLYLAVLAVLVLRGVFLVPWFEFVACLAFLRNFFQGTFQTMHFWSLAIEEQFYLVWPLAFLLLARSRRFIALTLALTATIAWYHVYHYFFRGHSTPWRTDLHVEPLLWGCWMAVALNHEKARVWITRTIRADVALAVFLLFVAGVTYGFTDIPVLRSVVGRFEYFAVAYAAAYLALRPESLPERVLEWRPLYALGSISYALYLWQQLFMRGGVQALWFQKLPYSVAFPLLAATLSYFLLEQPLLKIRRRFR